MASLNKVIIVGNLGRDPELKSTPSGSKVLEISVATTERIRDRENKEQWVDQTEWHRIVMWNQTAEYIARSTHKGSSVYVEGKIRYRKYTAQDGNERTVTEILADNVSVLSGRTESGSNFVGEQPQYQKPNGNQKPNNEETGDFGGDASASSLDDNLPF
jgi:single-strand DNA-binding protein